MQERLMDAEAMLRRALNGYKKVLGPEHSSTLDAFNSLGLVYEKLEKEAEALDMFSQALDGYERVLGPNHLSTLKVLDNIANVHYEQGSTLEAEPIWQRIFGGL
jgi:tetratricopeptide (TPR) repeat protein